LGEIIYVIFVRNLAFGGFSGASIGSVAICWLTPSEIMCFASNYSSGEYSSRCRREGFAKSAKNVEGWKMKLEGKC
jgi:hypothetical protein